ncbi:MAG: hypothetical protein PUC11_02495 [Elusimicrobia bacterium]|nr:hypothetical protein [Elusimicrobiota bacterium]
MITLPSKLAAKLNSNDLRGIKPVTWLYRNKWNAQTNTFDTESTPIDITGQVIKCGTLSTKLDVGEINEYTASNITLTLADPKNRFVENAPESLFPSGYQIYGSRVELYMGTGADNMTKLFTGVIRSLPNYKPEKYQLDIVLVSALELFKDIEAKDFSDKYTAETLVLEQQKDEEHPFYRTANTGVGGVTAVYANGIRLVEGVDYEISQLNSLSLPALIEIIKEELYGQTISADYYVWKKDLSVEQIVYGLAGLAGYDGSTADIRPVVWNTSVRNPPQRSRVFAGIGYYPSTDERYIFNWKQAVGSWGNTIGTGGRTHYLPLNFDFSFDMHLTTTTLQAAQTAVSIGSTHYGAEIDWNKPVHSGGASRRNIGPMGVYNGITFRQVKYNAGGWYGYPAYFLVYKITNGIATLLYQDRANANDTDYRENIRLEKRGAAIVIYRNGTLLLTVSDDISYQYDWQYNDGGSTWVVESQTWNIYNDELYPIGQNLVNPCMISAVNDKTECGEIWGAVNADIEESDASYFLDIFVANDTSAWTYAGRANLNTPIGIKERYLYFILGVLSNPDASFDISNPTVYFVAVTLFINLVNLSGLSVLEALQDLSLISGYEFGIDRNNVFFFRPMQTSTTPVYVLDKNELIKIDTVTQEMNSLFTKLTLTFGEVPLEFYANTGDRPTPIDRYGVRNKDIDKPDIVSYDNPELAQAIGPQLLELYSGLARKITCTGKLNLALELGDIVNLKREMPLTINPSASDYAKYEGLNTFYRACKITGLNYDFQKRQVKYTLRDVSNKNTEPLRDYYQYQTLFPTPLDYKE